MKEFKTKLMLKNRLVKSWGWARTFIRKLISQIAKRYVVL